jgi:hypothetical protein
MYDNGDMKDGRTRGSSIQSLMLAWKKKGREALSQRNFF